MTEKTEGAIEVAVADIQPDPSVAQFRDIAKPDGELQASVKELQAVVQPVLLRTKDSKPGYFLIDGERRWRAAKAASLKSVPAVVHSEVSDLEAAVMNLTSQARESYTDKELARALSRIMKLSEKELDEPLTDQKIADMVGISVRKLREVRRLYTKGASEILNSKKIEPRVASMASSLPKATQKDLAPKLEKADREEGLKIVRQAREKQVKKQTKSGESKGIRGRKPDDFPIVKDFKKTMKQLDKFLQEELSANARNKTRQGQREILDVLMGRKSVRAFKAGS
jgi:ParB family chromosome partitioning protein